MSGVLGCAEQYRAEIRWSGTAGPQAAQVFTVPALNLITSITWNRVLNDTAEAKVVIAKQGMGADCCGQLGSVREWAHELWIWRNDPFRGEQCVWQGPVVTIAETRTTITITANDVTAWLALCANYVNINYKGYDATDIAARIIQRNLTASLSTPKDYPAMLPYIVRENCGSKPTYKKGTWIAYVLDIVEDLADYGFQYTTVGRNLYLRDIKTEAARTQARLTGADLIGDITVTRNGLGARTNGFATNQQANQDTGVYEGKAYVASTPGTPYGRLDGIANLSDEDATTAQLKAAALAVKGSRYPAPVVLDAGQNAQIAPTAPVTIEQLVCGETFDVAMDDFCMPVQQTFRLTEVAAEWTDGTEKVTASFSSLSITGDDEGVA